MRALEDALTGSALQWKNYIILTNPGKFYYQNIRKKDATDEEYKDYYRFIRAELMTRAGVHLTNPGEHVKREWSDLTIPGDANYKDEIDAAIDKVVYAYIRLVRHGVHVASVQKDEEKLVQDLSEKVIKGTKMRMWMYEQYGLPQLTDVRDWLQRANEYGNTMRVRRKERVHALKDATPQPQHQQQSRQHVVVKAEPLAIADQEGPNIIIMENQNTEGLQSDVSERPRG